MEACPKCAGPLRDLRNTGFSPDAIAREGVCFAWGTDVFTCVRNYRRHFPVDQRLSRLPLTAATPELVLALHRHPLGAGSPQVVVGPARTAD